MKGLEEKIVRRGNSYAKSANPIDREGWLNTSGKIVTRMNVIKTWKGVIIFEIATYPKG